MFRSPRIWCDGRLKIESLPDDESKLYTSKEADMIGCPINLGDPYIEAVSLSYTTTIATATRQIRYVQNSDSECLKIGGQKET